MNNENWNNWNNYHPPAPEPQRAKETSPWVYASVAIAVIALLVGGSVAAFAILGDRNDDGDNGAAPAHSANSSSEAPAEVNESSASAPSGAPEANGESTAPPKKPTPDAPEDETESQESNRSTGSAQYSLSRHGWEGSSAHCNSDDEWLYAAYGDGDYVVVCKVGQKGDYYYRGDVGGYELEKDVDMAYADPGRGSYRVPVGGGTRIEINQKSLKVFEHGEVASNIQFDEYFVENP